MKQFLGLALALTIASILFCLPIKAQQDLQVVKQHYRQILLSYADSQEPLWKDLIQMEPEAVVSDQVIVELMQRYPYDVPRIEQYLSKQKSDGSWEDIDYQDKKRSGWEPKKHAERVLELSKLFHSPSTKYYHSEKVLQSIHSALAYWFTNKPVCPNWWYNQIGVPKTFGEAFVLLEDQLSPKEKVGAIEVMDHAKFGMTGQNKVWLAGNVLVRALLEDNVSLVKEARDVIASEIVLGRQEGIKDDWSFHQHGPQQQFGNYGMAFITGMAFYYKLFKGTSFAFEQEKVNILTSLMNEGYRWILWHRYFDINAMGRQLFHNGQIHKAYSTGFAASDFGLKGLDDKENHFIGHKHFDDSDYTIHRMKDWMASLKMSSSRVIGTEKVNEDNLLGYYLGDGATYFYVDGDEYLNIFPFWDWHKVPGVTAYEGALSFPPQWKGNQSNLVGGLTDGAQGMSAMELNRDRLKAYKSWLFTDEFVLCLGAGIESDSTLNVTTSVDQCLKKDELLMLNGKHWESIGSTEGTSKDVRFYHGQTGYILMDKTNYAAEEEHRTGRWHDFMGMYKSEDVEGDVISIYIQHGERPQEESYQYLVLPASSVQAVKNFNTKQIRVLRNDSQAQIVELRNTEDYWLTAYQAGRYKIGGRSIEIITPGVYHLKKIGKNCQIVKSNPFRIGI